MFKKLHNLYYLEKKPCQYCLNNVNNTMYDKHVYTIHKIWNFLGMCILNVYARPKTLVVVKLAIWCPNKSNSSSSKSSEVQLLKSYKIKILLIFHCKFCVSLYIFKLDIPKKKEYSFKYLSCQHNNKYIWHVICSTNGNVLRAREVNPDPRKLKKKGMSGKMKK